MSFSATSEGVVKLNHQRHIESRQQFKSLRNASLASWQEVDMGEGRIVSDFGDEFEFV